MLEAQMDPWTLLLQTMPEAPTEPGVCLGPCLLLVKHHNGEQGFIVGIWNGSVWCDLDWELLEPIRWALLPRPESFPEIPAARP